MAERVLILGGTQEARELAEALEADPRFDAVLSLAGRTRAPRLAGRSRSGGFGGADGLARYLAEQAIGRLIDASHPFARRISAHAAAAGVPTLRLERPAWRPGEGDRWIAAGDEASARAALPAAARRVFLALGPQQLAAFAGDRDRWYLVRRIDPPDGPPPLFHGDWIVGRGPFAAADEEALLRANRIDVLVARNSGGAAMRGKLDAARTLGLPVVMIARPPAPASMETVGSVAAALAWLAAPAG